MSENTDPDSAEIEKLKAEVEELQYIVNTELRMLYKEEKRIKREMERKITEMYEDHFRKTKILQQKMDRLRKLEDPNGLLEDM